MTITNTIIRMAIDTAKEIFSQQTADELKILQEHFGKAYDESKIVAEITAKLILRIGKIQTAFDVRHMSPVDDLVVAAEDVYAERFGV